MRKLKLKEVMAQGSGGLRTSTQTLWYLCPWTGRPRKEAVGKRTGLERWAHWSGHLCLQKTENWIPIYLNNNNNNNQQQPEILLKQVPERLKADAESRDWNYYGSASFHLSRLFSSMLASFSGCLSSYGESRKLPASNKKSSSLSYCFLENADIGLAWVTCPTLNQSLQPKDEMFLLAGPGSCALFGSLVWDRMEPTPPEQWVYEWESRS